MLPTSDEFETAEPVDAESPMDAQEQEYEADECAKVAEFEERIKIPNWCQDVYNWMDEDAKYISEECIYAQLDDEHSTSTNYILRNQFVLISQIFARNPTARIQPAPMMGDQPPGLVEFAKTLEIMAKRLTDEAGFKQKLSGMIQDTQTYGISWLKVSVQQDILKDPIGAGRQNDQLDNVARLQVLLQQFQDGEFDEDSAQHKDLVDLSDTVKTYLAGNMREDIARNPPQPVESLDEMGPPTLVPDPADPRLAQLQELEDPSASVTPGVLPEVPTYIGINIDEVQPQDFRFDWSITRPEDFYNAGWVAHRVYMTKEDIDLRWSITSEEWSARKSPAVSKNRGKSRSSTEEDPSNRSSTDGRVINDRIAVWEMMDKAANRRYVWVEGMERFLVNEVVKAQWHKFFNYFPLVFNRVTGRFLPMSDVRLQRPLQEEINTKRTHEREACAAAYPRYVIAAGAASDDEKEKLENARPFAVIELQKPDEVMKHFHNIAADKPDPLLYDTSKPIREIEISAGIPQQAAGGVGGAEFATEVAVANQQMGVQADRRKTMIEDLIHDVNECVIELALQLFPEENAKALAGQGAVWPLLDREHLWRQLNVVIEPGMSGKPDQAQVIAKWTGFSDIMNRIGLTVNPMEVGRKIIEELNLGMDFKRLIIDPALIANAAGADTPGGPGQPSQSSGAAAKPPTPAGVPGQGAGAPPMAARTSSPTPDSVNNRPTGKTA
jgi:hypothetical protein